MVDGLVVDARNWETQTLAAAALGTEGIARMLENWETQTGEGRGEGRGGAQPDRANPSFKRAPIWEALRNILGLHVTMCPEVFRRTQLKHVSMSLMINHTKKILYTKNLLISFIQGQSRQPTSLPKAQGLAHNHDNHVKTASYCLGT